MELAALVSTWSKDSEHQVGAVIVNQSKRVLSLGYNGPPSGTGDEGPNKCKVVHAEVNTILNCTSRPDCGTIYVYPFMPCVSCAAVIAQSGIKRVVYSLHKPVSDKWLPAEAYQVLLDAGVELDSVQSS